MLVPSSVDRIIAANSRLFDDKFAATTLHGLKNEGVAGFLFAVLAVVDSKVTPTVASRYSALRSRLHPKDGKR